MVGGRIPFVRVRCARHKTDTFAHQAPAIFHESSSLLFRFHVWNNYDSLRPTQSLDLLHLDFPTTQIKARRLSTLVTPRE